MEYAEWRKELSRLQGLIEEYDENLDNYDTQGNLRHYWTNRKPLTDALMAHYELEPSAF